MTPVIFFDIGQTLATARLDADRRLIGFTVLPGVLAALEGLRARFLRMGIISNRDDIPAETVTRELDRSGLLEFFDQRLIIFAPKDSPAPFSHAAAQAGVPTRECYFVGESNEERSHALRCVCSVRRLFCWPKARLTCGSTKSELSQRHRQAD